MSNGHLCSRGMDHKGPCICPFLCSDKGEADALFPGPPHLAHTVRARQGAHKPAGDPWLTSRVKSEKYTSGLLENPAALGRETHGTPHPADVRRACWPSRLLALSFLLSPATSLLLPPFKTHLVDISQNDPSGGFLYTCRQSELLLSLAFPPALHGHLGSHLLPCVLGTSAHTCLPTRSGASQYFIHFAFADTWRSATY